MDPFCHLASIYPFYSNKGKHDANDKEGTVSFLKSSIS